jgi:hypothetical protein
VLRYQCRRTLWDDVLRQSEQKELRKRRVFLTLAFVISCGACTGLETLECWGRNDEGQLGDGTTSRRTVPTPVKGISNVVDVATGAVNTCAIVADGSVWCWGDNKHGQLGIGSIGGGSQLPVGVQGL